MATNKLRWIRNLYGATAPLIMRGKFQAGDTQAIKRGEILEFTGDTNTAWVPIDSDFAMDSNVCIANEEIKAGDRAGYYEVIVPRPGDVFEFDLAAAGATAVGTALYYSSSEAVTVSAGSNIIGYAVGQEHYPQKQGHLADDASGDAGTTIKSISVVRMVFTRAASLWSLFQV
jgi:predicted RecA/RadA family phage recombinase